MEPTPIVPFKPNRSIFSCLNRVGDPVDKGIDQVTLQGKSSQTMAAPRG